MSKNCYICRFDVEDGICEAKDREWHKQAKKEMDQKINLIKTQKADDYMNQLIF